MADTKQEKVLTTEELLAKVKQLEADNALLKTEHKRAQEAARNNAVLLSQFQEVHAGKTEPDKDGNQEDLWEYTVELAPNAGQSIRLNGFEFFHGQSYTFTTSQLQSIKDIVYRGFVHEANIFGHQNENFYRQQSSRSITNGRVINMSR